MSKGIKNINPTLTYRVLHKMKLLNDVQKHGDITFFGLIGFAISTVVKRALFTYSYKGVFPRTTEQEVYPSCHLETLRM